MSETLIRIAEKHPLSNEHAEDGRYSWPERWHEAHTEVAAIEAKLEAARHLLASAPKGFVPLSSWSQAVDEWLKLTAAQQEGR